MFNAIASAWFRWWGREPCFRIWAKSQHEDEWRVVDVFATFRRDVTSRWPLWGGTCITWTAGVIAVGWDFAERAYREQAAEPASRTHPLAVAGGRIRDSQRRLAVNAPTIASAGEILAHECGHTWQARRLGFLYWPLVGSTTLFREGPHFWNYFENQASAIGQFGGIVNGSVSALMLARIQNQIV